MLKKCETDAIMDETIMAIRSCANESQLIDRVRDVLAVYTDQPDPFEDAIEWINEEMKEVLIELADTPGAMRTDMLGGFQRVVKERITELRERIQQ